MVLNELLLLNALQGGDLRSLGDSGELVSAINTQQDFDVLFSLLYHTERKVVMRASDAVEKISRSRFELLKPHKKKILQLCKVAHFQELKWHLALMVVRFKLSKSELGIVWHILQCWVLDRQESRIVRVHALQGMYDLLAQCSELKQDLYLIISELEHENIPSLQARIRRLILLLQ